MDYLEFKRHLGKAALNTKSFAELVKMKQSSITNYKQKGNVPNHLAIIVVLMGEMAENKIDFKSKLRKIDMKEPVKRPKAFGRNKENNKDDSFENQ